MKVVVEYDGTDYSGFQFQPGVPTIQSTLEKVLSTILKEQVRIYGSGRTDAGVHASGQVINFFTEGSIPIDRLCIAMNTLLPPSICALGAQEMDLSFNSRYDAKARLYEYTINNAEVRSALNCRYTWHIRHPLNVVAMDEGIKHLLGVHDFSSFASADRDEGSPIRDLSQAFIKQNDDIIVISLRANAFLRSMVRVIVGTLVEVGLGLRQPSQVKAILEAADRTAAGRTAPASGLCLVHVEY